jgi:hypothetical protein
LVDKGSSVYNIFLPRTFFDIVPIVAVAGVLGLVAIYLRKMTAVKKK